MNKKEKTNANKSPARDVHATDSSTLPSPDGHVVYPELIRPQTRLESLSRTVRSLIPSFVPSTSPIPSTLPTSSTDAASQRRYSSYAFPAESSDILEESSRVNAVSWSNWVSLHSRTFLFVAYEQSGFHIWDFTQLDTVKELLYLTSVGPVISASIVSSPLFHRNSPILFLLTGSGDNATLCVYSLLEHTFLKRICIPYARTIQANDRFVCVGVDISASRHAVRSSNESVSPAIHVLAAFGEYKHLYTVPGSSISPHTSSSPTFALSSSRLLTYASTEPPAHLQSTKTTSSTYPPSNPFSPLPTSSPSPASNFTTGLSVVGSAVLTGAMRLGTGVLEGVKMGINAAGYGGDTVGERDTEGRRVVSRSAPATHVSPLSAKGHTRRASAQVRPAVPGGPGGHAGVADGGEWITVVDLQPLLGHAPTTEADLTIHSPLSHSGFFVTSPQLSHLEPVPADVKPPETVVEFPYTSSSSAAKVDPISHVRGSPTKYGSHLSAPRLPSTHSTTSNPASKAVMGIKWNPDGSMLAVGGADGNSVRIFSIVRGRRVAGVESDKKGKNSGENGAARLVYELMRGVTPASIRDIRWSADGLWCGFVSDKGTLHVYALHPQAGEADGISHLSGRILNSSKRLFPTAPVQALARLRQPIFGMNQDELRSVSDVAGETAPPTPIPIFLFLPHAISRSSSRLPEPPEQHSAPISLVNMNSDPSRTNSDSNSHAGFNDTLLFLPHEGRAVLWRCTLHLPPVPPPITKSTAPRRVQPSPSIVGDSPSPTSSSGLPSSLPIGGVLSGVAKITGLGDSGLTNVMSRGNRLTVETALLASWDVGRGDSWPEVKSAVWVAKTVTSDEASRQTYVSHAELTTFHSRSPTIPRPIYLSHQFNFSSFMNDYYALVRRLVLDPPTTHIAMRKESVIVRGGDDLYLHLGDSRTSLPGDFDSDGNFLGAGTMMGPMGGEDNPLAGGELGLPVEGVPLSSSLGSTNLTSHSHSSQSRSGRRSVGKPFDDGLSLAIESHLQLNASHSPSGSSSDMASPGRVIPMLPNGRPGSGGNGVSAGLDAVVRSTARVGKEVWTGLGAVRSPRLMPTKRANNPADLLKFDEEDEMFVVDGLEDGGALEGTTNLGAVEEDGSRREGSLATIGPGIGIHYPLSGTVDGGSTKVGISPAVLSAGPPGEEGTWVEQAEVYAQAVEEDARFDDVMKVLEEEREERRALRGGRASPVTMSSSILVSEPGKGKRKNTGKKKRR